MTCIQKFHLFLLNAFNIFIRLKLPKSASATTLTGKLRMQPHLAYPTSHISAGNKVKKTSHACSCLILMTTYSPYMHHVPIKAEVMLSINLEDSLEKCKENKSVLTK